MAEEPMVDDQETTDSPSEDRGPEDSGADLARDDSDGGDANRRIRKLSKDKRQAMQQAEYWRGVATRLAEQDSQAAQSYQQPQYSQQPQGNFTPQQPTPYPNEEVERAFSTLKNRGMVTREELDNVMLRIEWDRMHDRNEAEINRRNSNMPEYDRNEVEAHARRKDIADPMAAYRDLYFDEIVDAAKRGDYRASSRSSRVATERPSRTSDSNREPLTLDSFRDKLKGEKGKEYYEKLLENPAEFDKVISQLSEES